MTDYTKLIERLRNVGSPICLTAADAIEALQAENELLKRNLDSAKDVLHQDQECILRAVADRDALQAKLDELQRQEPVGYTDNTGIAFAVKWSGELPPNLTLYAAPKALEPLTRIQINQMMADAGWQNSAIRHADLDGVEKVVRAVERNHGITKGTPT